MEAHLDIVERLRALAREYHQHRPHYVEAADEIERLRDELSAGEVSACGVIGGLEAEIERLRALLRAIMDDTSDGQESMSFDIRDRIERALEPKP